MSSLHSPLYIYSTLMPPWPADSLDCYYMLTDSGFLLRVTGAAFCEVLVSANCNKCRQVACSDCGDKVHKCRDFAFLLVRVRVFIGTSWLFAKAIGLSSYFYRLLVTISFSCTLTQLCVIISTVCYTKIYLELRNHHTAVQNQQKQSARKEFQSM